MSTVQLRVQELRETSVPWDTGQFWATSEAWKASEPSESCENSESVKQGLPFKLDSAALVNQI